MQISEDCYVTTRTLNRTLYNGPSQIPKRFSITQYCITYVIPYICIKQGSVLFETCGFKGIIYIVKALLSNTVETTFLNFYRKTCYWPSIRDCTSTTEGGAAGSGRTPQRWRNGFMELLVLRGWGVCRTQWGKTPFQYLFSKTAHFTNC